MPSNGVVYVLSLMAVIFLIGGWAYYRVLGRLKLRHGLIWEDLGRPEIFRMQSALVELRFKRFLFLRRYANLSDRKLSILGDLLLACWAMLFCLFLYLISIGCGDLRACFETRPANVRHSTGITDLVTPPQTKQTVVTVERIAIGVWALNGILVLLYLALSELMIRRLRKLYPDTWKALGQPSLLNSTIYNSWLFGKFILTRRYTSLGNSNVARMGDALLVLGILVLCLSVSFVFLMPAISHPTAAATAPR